MAGLLCWNCGASLDDVPRPISRHATCAKCFEVLHCCRMCRWFAPGRPQDCDHDRAEPPVEKASANFCEFFSPSTRAFDADDASERSAARSRADALFGDDAGDSGEPDGDAPLRGGDDNLKSKLDDLFDD